MSTSPSRDERRRPPQAEGENHRPQGQEEPYRHVYCASPNGIAFYHPDGEVWEANDAFLRIIDRTHQELRNGSIRWEIPAEGERITTTAGTATRITWEQTFEHPSGTSVWGVVEVHPPDEARAYGVVYLRDATRLKERERALRREERKFRALFDSNVVGHVFWTHEGELIDANDAFLNMLGYKREELSEINWIGLTPPEYLHIDRDNLAQMRQTGFVPPFEKEYFHKDGHRVPVIIGASAVEGEGYGVAFVLDYSGQVAQRRLLEEQQTQFQALYDSELMGVAFWDVEGGFLAANDAFLQIIGYTQADMASGQVRWDALTPSDYHEADGRALEQLHARGYCDPYSKEYVHREGHRVAVLCGGAFLDKSRRVGVSYQLDITDLKQTRRALKRTEKRFQALADNIAQFAWMTDAAGAVFWLNQRWFDYSGSTLAEMDDWGWGHWVHPDHVDRVLEKFRRSVAAAGVWEDTFPLRGRDGHYRWFLSRAVPLHDASGEIINWFGTNTDITELREAEQALKAGEERFRLVTRATNDLVWDWEVNTDRVWWNDAFETRFGFTAEDRERHSSEWTSFVHPEDRARVELTLQKLFEERGEQWTAEYRSRRADGTYAYVLNRAYLLHDDEGRPVRMLGSIMDVSTLKEAQRELRRRAAELERVNEELRRSKAINERTMRGIREDNERKTRELEEARRVQRAMLPQTPPRRADLDAAFFMETSTEVGGDYYDYLFDDQGRITFAVGDATGHGMRAGIVVATVKSYFQTLASRIGLPSTLRAISAGIRNLQLRGMYMGLCLIEWGGEHVRLVASGMPPLFVYRAATGRVETIVLKGLFLGTHVEREIAEREITLQTGDALLAISDGLIELFNPEGEMFGTQRVVDALADAGGRTAQGVIDHLLHEARAWQEERDNDDDVTIVVLRKV
ncbi:MAG: PAS domain S-box protein [Catalinimonas sp.]